MSVLYDIPASRASKSSSIINTYIAPARQPISNMDASMRTMEAYLKSIEREIIGNKNNFILDKKKLESKQKTLHKLISHLSQYYEHSPRRFSNLKEADILLTKAKQVLLESSKINNYQYD